MLYVGNGRSELLVALLKTPLRVFSLRGIMPPEASLVSPHGRGLSCCPGPGSFAAGHSGSRRNSSLVQASAERASRSAARTSAAWPSGVTFVQTTAIRPSGSTRKLFRATPQYVLPYFSFCTQLP